MKNSLTESRGFSLVEVIVVSVLIAVLASIGIPMYAGYIRDQRQSVVDNLAETAAANANAYWRRTGTNLSDGDVAPNTDPLNLYFDNVKYRVSISGARITAEDRNDAAIIDTASYR
ncbi:MAG: prepilin-type N-terminal cleavage/methylation domain-containing protein [Chitinispirillaceae bacterium]|nr:prepilin-type N-terminal cleavage/methylation domain-containing protein [Chitinispirillaceae bacterium]